MQTSTSKKPLLRISNLKQYFPLKAKGLYVKANDGITLDIYEGETLGLVGESGCGKSTLGRTLLQLYRQTDGRTMYYGRTLDEIAPEYVGKTYANLAKNIQQMHALEQKHQSLKTEAEALADGPAKYAKMDEAEHARKEANDAFLDIANLIGGFITVKDIAPVAEAYTNKYKASVARRKLQLKMEELQLDKADAVFAAEQSKADGKNAAAAEKKLSRVEAKVASLQKKIDEADEELAKAHKVIDDMRKPYADDAEFQRNEAYLDDGVDLARLKYEEIRHLRADLQMIFQDPYSSLNPRMTVGQIISEGMRAHNMFKKSDDRLQQAVLKVMEDAGLQAYFIHRYPHQFSGGQRQRIGIARSLAVNPKFVVCDEAVSALDVSIQSQIINLLKDLKEQQNLTYLFITHDLSVVKYISDRIGVMYLGNMVELASSADLFSKPLHPYTEALMNAIPTTDVDSEREIQVLEGDIPSPVRPPKGCKFHTRCKYATEICKHMVPQWEEVGPDHFVACHHYLGKDESAADAE
nr:ATP-binding cassette domain-containing protein [Clostridia bacterium]